MRNALRGCYGGDRASIQDVKTAQGPRHLLHMESNPQVETQTPQKRGIKSIKRDKGQGRCTVKTERCENKQMAPSL